MSNNYTTLFSKPALTARKMLKELEELAQRLVISGLLRVDANERSNFVRWQDLTTGTNLTFTHKELNDSVLKVKSSKILESFLARDGRGKDISKEFLKLQNKVNKIALIDNNTEEKLARIIVQSCEKCVIEMALIECAQIFVSYAHNVGDMLDINSWQSHGESGGLQSTNSDFSSVYIAAGGNPFISDKKLNYTGDGTAALKRMMVIAGQELGHYADMVRDKNGNKIARFSSDLQCRKATEGIKKARRRDLKHAVKIRKNILSFKLKEACEMERHLAFFKKQKRHGLIVLNTMRRKNNIMRSIRRKVEKNNIGFVLGVPDKKHMPTSINLMLDDMLFNLQPDSDAYKRPTKEATEAVMCVEALARVPQQVIKWGHEITRNMMPNLYKAYYGLVIPSCRQYVEHINLSRN